MENKEYRTVDKTKWERGPWDNEPDKIQWQDEETGLPCLIVRNSYGALCGYVGVPEGHKFYQKHYDKCPVDVHGGLTFSGMCQPGDEAHHVCHVPGPGEPDHVWWLGFDCAHLYDLCPRYTDLEDAGINWPRWPEDTYKDVPYVKDEVRNLARQIKAAV